MKLYLFISNGNKMLIGQTPIGTLVPHDEVGEYESLQEAAERILMDQLAIRVGVHISYKSVICPDIKTDDDVGLVIIAPELKKHHFGCIDYNLEGKPLLKDPHWVDPDTPILNDSWRKVTTTFNSL